MAVYVHDLVAFQVAAWDDHRDIQRLAGWLCEHGICWGTGLGALHQAQWLYKKNHSDFIGPMLPKACSQCVFIRARPR